MANTLNKTNIKKGSALNLWVTIGNEEKCIAWSTSHTFQSSSNLTEVNVKDAGDYPLQLAQNISWNIQCEYLYSTSDNVGQLLAIHKAKTPVKITFCEVSNYVNDEQGIIGTSKDAWQAGNVIAEGNVIINDVTINSAAGENASISCTLTGDGQYTSAWSYTPTGGVTGPNAVSGATPATVSGTQG